MGWVWAYVFVFYLSLGLFAVLNVMTGIFCQSALASAGKDTELVVTSWNESRQSMVCRRKFSPGRVARTQCIGFLVKWMPRVGFCDYFFRFPVMAARRITMISLEWTSLLGFEF